MTICYVIESHSGLYMGESILSPKLRRIGYVAKFEDALKFADRASAEAFMRGLSWALNFQDDVCRGVMEHMWEQDGPA